MKDDLQKSDSCGLKSERKKILTSSTCSLACLSTNLGAFCPMVVHLPSEKSILPYFSGPRGVAISVPFPEVRNRKGAESGLGCPGFYFHFPRWKWKVKVKFNLAPFVFVLVQYATACDQGLSAETCNASWKYIQRKNEGCLLIVYTEIRGKNWNVIILCHAVLYLECLCDKTCWSFQTQFIFYSVSEL